MDFQPSAFVVEMELIRESIDSPSLPGVPAVSEAWRQAEAADRGNRVVCLTAEVANDSTFPLITALLSYNASGNEPIHLFITSPGGDVFSGLSLVDTMLHVEAPVFTYCIGVCASMAAVILAAGEPGHRYILPHSRVMVHQASGSAAGKMEDLKSTIGLQSSLAANINALLSEFTGKSLRAIRQASRTDKWMSAEQAKGFGIVDFVLARAPGKEIDSRNRPGTPNGIFPADAHSSAPNNHMKRRDAAEGSTAERDS